MQIHMFPEIYWQWQQRMRREFPQQWAQIKNARDVTDVIMFMNQWLNTSTDLATPITIACDQWMERMNHVAGGSPIILPPGVRLN